MPYLRSTDFGPRDTSKPGVEATLWGQYLLDNAQNVEEVILGAAARAQERARSHCRHSGHRAQCLGPVRRALPRVRNLQHRMQNGVQRHRQGILLRVDHQP